MREHSKYETPSDGGGSFDQVDELVVDGVDYQFAVVVQCGCGIAVDVLVN